MRLAHMALKRLNAADNGVTVEDVMVWLPFGWFAHMVLKEVTGPEFGELERLVISMPTPRVLFKDGGSPTYDYNQEMAWIEMYHTELIEEFVRRGALRDPQVMLGLGRSLFAKLESQLEQRRARRS